MMLEDFGIMTVPREENEVIYDYREIFRYCREQNIKTEDLSEEELKQFEISKK